MSTWENLVGLEKMQDWSNNDYITFILLPQGYDYNRLKSQLDWCINKNIGPDSDKWTKLELEKFSDIHMGNFREPMFYITLVAFLILLVACFNFINISTARSATRAKEIGIRKVVGALKTQIIKQLLFESVLTTLISYFVALFLVAFIIPGFNELLSADISINQLADFKLISILTIIAVIIGIFAGILPSFFFASFKPYKILSGALAGSGRKASFRKTLVVAQFTISSIFIVCIGIISSQLDFMLNKKLGFNKNGILILPSSNFIQNNFEAVKQQLLQNPNIISVTGASRVPPDQLNDAGGASVFINNEFKNIEFRLPYIEVDRDYIPTFEMKIIAGRNFLQQFQTDLSESFILNETAVKKMGFKYADEAINIPLRYNNRSGIIIGVVKDFHFEAVNRKISPIVMLQSPSYKIIAARINGKNIQSTLTFLQTKWAEYNPNHSFHCSFVDYMFERQYSGEMRIREIFTYSSLLAILIACLGLFGLAAHLIQQRTKDIGIRKVLGASVPAILYMLSKDFAKWVILANIIAWPIAWYVMKIWLQNFAYRIDISWWIFVLSGGIALAIALITVSFQSIKAAIANPIKALRYE
jgi:putative ABC transport system permease protein